MLQSPSHGGGGSLSSSLASTLASRESTASSKKVVVCEEVFDEHSQPTFEGKIRLFS